MSVNEPSIDDSDVEASSPVSRMQEETAKKSPPSIGWVIWLSLLTAAAPELAGRYLFQAHGASYGVTGMLTLVSILLWGTSAIYVIHLAHGMPRVTRTLFAGVSLVVLSQASSMCQYFRVLDAAGIVDGTQPVLAVLEEGCFVLGVVLIFVAFYLSILSASRAAWNLEKKTEALAREIADHNGAEEALRQAREAIEERIRERTASLHDANRKLRDEIHERKKFEHALRESRKQYRMLAEASQDVIFTINRDDTVVYVNSYAGKQIGRDPKDIVGRKRNELFPQEVDQGQRASLEKVFSTGEPLRVENRARFQGREGWQDTHLIPVKDETGAVISVMGVSRDITQRKRNEETLRQREVEARGFLEQLRSLHEVSAELARVAEQGTFDDLCRRAVELGVSDLGFERIGLWFYEAVTNEAYGSFGVDETGAIRDERKNRFVICPESTMHRVIAKREPSWVESACPIYDLQGNEIGKGWVANATLWDGAEILGFLGTDTLLTGRPISDRQWEILTLYATMIANLCRLKRTEQTLRDSEERHRGLIEGLSEAVYRMSLPDGRYEYAGSATQVVFGYSRQKFLENPRFIDEIIHPDSAAYLAEMWDRLIKGEMPSTYEYRIVDPEGKERWILQSNTLLRSDAGVPIAIEGICRDITEQKQAHQMIEEQRAKFLDAAKMSVLGEMASNVAHEINNPLAIVSGSAEQLQTILKSDVAPKEHIPRLTDTIIRNVARIQTIIKGLRTFAHKGEHDPFQLTPLKTIVDDTVVLCRDLFASQHVALTIEEIPADLVIECRPTQVMEVLFNLLSNALHAVENCNDKWVTIAASDEGSEVALSVIDGGAGVPPEIAKTMFDRFFTSKEFGKGMGLGLSISKRIVLTHNGSLSLDETSPHTRFVIRLPKKQTEDDETETSAPVSLSRA